MALVLAAIGVATLALLVVLDAVEVRSHFMTALGGLVLVGMVLLQRVGTVQGPRDGEAST